MNGIEYIKNTIEQYILNIDTAYLAQVLQVNGKTARLQPLTVHKVAGSKAKKQSTTTAVIPSNIKYKEETITYKVTDIRSETKTVLTPDKIAVGDIVLVVVCDRDITHAIKGVISEATQRHHDINDGVIVRVL